jgi:ABC-2 type transport system ATP-binding protein
MLRTQEISMPQAASKQHPAPGADIEVAGSPDPAVTVQNLVKTYPGPEGGSFNALDGVSFQVGRGEIFGFLGPNGAGKTTTLEIIEGIKEPTSGRVNVLGLDTRRDRKQIKDRIGVQLQAGAYFDFLTLQEILELFGSFYTRRLDPTDLLDRVGLQDKRSAFVKHLSGGQARRFSVVAALVNDPEVVFLDEPTTGLDPQARRTVWDLVRSINHEGTTVVLTTHYMEEAEALSDRIAIIDRGRIQALDTPRGLIRGLGVASRIRFTTAQRVSTEDLERLPGVVGVAGGADGESAYELRADRTDDALGGLVRWSESAPALLEDIEVRPATLEDVFLSVTGRRLRD